MAQPLLTQQGILDALQDSLARFRTIINQLDEVQQQTAFSPEGWSVKDFLSHTSHWKAATHKLLVAYTHDQPLPPPTPDGDAGNAEAREMDKALSLPYVRTYWEEVHQHLTHLVSDDLNDQKLTEEVRAPWSASDSAPICEIIADICEHDAEHFAIIEQYFELVKQE